MADLPKYSSILCCHGLSINIVFAIYNHKSLDNLIYMKEIQRKLGVNNSANYFDNFPHEIIFLIALFLTTKDIAKLAQVDKRFRDIVYKHIEVVIENKSLHRSATTNLRKWKYSRYAHFFKPLKKINESIVSKDNE